MYSFDMIRPLDLNDEHWDMLAENYTQEQRDWEERDVSKWADLIDPSTISIFEGGH